MAGVSPRVARPQGIVVATQREDLWHTRACQTVVERLQDEGVWTPVEITGPAPYLPEGYGGTAAVGCYYLTAPDHLIGGVVSSVASLPNPCGGG